LIGEITRRLFLNKTNRWYALAVLTAILTAHQIDKAVISVVVEPVKHEFQLSDTAMGVLTGLAQSVGLCIFIMPMGWLVDRFSRVRIIAAGVIIWSGLTAVGAIASTYALLALTRFGVGAAEACAPPASISLVSDIFPAKERPIAIGLYYLHVAFGTGIIFLSGGYIAHHYGWRTDLLLAGAPGMLLGLLLLVTVPEPARDSHEDSKEAPSFLAFLKMASRSPFLLFVMLGGTTASIAQASTWAWISSFFIRNHGLTLTQIGTLIAISAGAAKGIGSAISGPMVRRLSGDRNEFLWRYPGAILALSVPVGWLMVTASSTAVAMGCSIALGILLGGWAAPIVVMLVAGSPTRIRGSSVSLYYLSTNLIGAGFGPVITGAMSDAFGGNAGIGRAIAFSLSINLLSTLSLFLACRYIGKSNAVPAELTAAE
jgi:MFS family permease